MKDGMKMNNHKWLTNDEVIENVVSYYEPLIKPQISGRHYFWANFKIPHGLDSVKMGRMGKLKNGDHGEKNRMLDEFGFDLSKYQNVDKRHVLRNCVTPEIGLAIFQSALNIYDSKILPCYKQP